MKTIKEMLPGLFETPDLYIPAIDPDTDKSALFIMNRDSYTKSAFLDERAVSVDNKRHSLPLSLVLKHYNQSRPESRPVNYIFHVACCGSTHLCRVLDRPGICLPYKEPFLIHQLAHIRRLSPHIEAKVGNPGFLRLVVALLSRTYGSSEAPLVKPTDSCINMARSLLRQHPASRALLLYLPLESFLLAMLKGDERRKYIRGMIGRSRFDLAYLGFLKDVEPDVNNDSEVAAFVWLSLMYSFMDLLADRTLKTASLDAGELMNNPYETISAIETFLGLEPIDMTSLNTREHNVFTSNSKDTDKVFDLEAHRLETQSLAIELQDEIHAGVKWAESAMKDYPVPDILPNHLKIKAVI